MSSPSKKSDSQRLHERYLSIKNYLVYQQCIFIALLNDKYNFEVEKPLKIPVITSSLLKVNEIYNKDDSIDVISFVEGRCEEKKHADRSNGIPELTVQRRYISNKTIENHHLLIDLLFDEGYSFKSSFSSGKNNSYKMETVESILLNNKPFMKRDDIETLGKDIHDHLIKMFGNNKVLRIEQGEPSIKALLHIVH